MLGLVRLRVIIVTLMMLVVALAAGDVFDLRLWWLLVPPAVVGLAAFATLTRRWPVRVASAVAAVAGATAVAVVASGGTGADFAAAFGAGSQRLLSTEWPSPDRADLVGTIATGLGLATALAAELARSRRLHLSPLLPVLIAQLLVTALSSPAGVRLRWVLPLSVLAILFATLRPDTGVDLRGRLTLLRGERRLLPVALIALGVAAFLTVPLTISERADPRRTEEATRSAVILDPIEATLALQAIDPPIDLHEIRITETDDEASDRRPLHWRTAALEVYDGRRWAPDLVLRPIGRRLSGPAPDTITASITFRDDDLQLFPLPGAPVVVGAAIETDDGRTLVRLVERPLDDEQFLVTARVEPAVEDALGAIGVREVDENSVGLAELATGLAQQGGANDTTSLLGQLRAIEATMQEDFVLRSDSPGGGLQRALIERFLRDTQRGNAEQFSTAFVLLVRSLGVDARVATGFVVGPERLRPDGDATTLTLRSDDARVWPEVRIGDQWVAFDPVPAEADVDAAPPEPDPQVQTPAAPQPPVVPPPETADEPIVTEDTTDTDTASGLPTVVRYALWGLAGLAVLAVPLLLFVGLILGIKWRRRRRRLSGPPGERIRGAWALATNALVDGGMTISTSDTNDEIASDAVSYVPAAQREVRRLATLASATTFGDPARPDLLAEDATTCLGHVESSMAASRSFWQRSRWRLSLRSLRRRTASPV
jgi:transglutaminase-like putative cysteine protease